MPSPVLKGLGVALSTPFASTGEVDKEVLRMHVSTMVAAEVDFLVALGTTAETPTLSENERREVTDIVLSNHENKPIVYGLGSNSTEAVISQLKSDRDYLKNFSAILSVTPYYNKPSQRGLIAHFSHIADNCPIPIILYNVPGRTGVNMLPETTLELARLYPGQIIAVKEASGSLDAIRTIIDNSPEGFQVFSGDDNTAHETIKAGGAGVISVAGNAFPRLMKQLVDCSACPDKWDEALAIHQRMAQMDKLLFRDGNPSGIKCALSLLPDSRWQNIMRLPLVPVTEDTCKAMQEAIPLLIA